MQQAPHPSRGAGPATLYHYNIREIIGEGLQALLGVEAIITLIRRGVRTQRLIGSLTVGVADITRPPIDDCQDTTVMAIITIEAIKDKRTPDLIHSLNKILEVSNVVAYRHRLMLPLARD